LIVALKSSIVARKIVKFFYTLKTNLGAHFRFLWLAIY
jgi:hypothetical protein